MPHTIYLHSRLVLSRKVNTKSYQKTQDANNYNALESSFWLLVSYILNLSVVGTFAYYAKNSKLGFQSNDEINLYNADEALKSTFGSSARYIWAIGLLAAG